MCHSSSDIPGTHSTACVSGRQSSSKSLWFRDYLAKCDPHIIQLVALELFSYISL